MFENNEKRLSPVEKKRVKSFLKGLTGKRIWKLTEFYNEMLFRLPAMKQALLHAGNGNRVYTYYWTYPGEDHLLRACHAMELTYVFGTLEEKILTGDHINKGLSDTVQEMWVNFARCGNPSTGQYVWEPYGRPDRKTIVFSGKPHMEEDIKAEQRKMLEGLLHHYFNGCYAQLSYNVPCVRKAAMLAAGLGAATVLMISELKRK
jgi:para-nitrobenzyl esterase